jgi:UDP-N-acetylglucosamine--N-acetylmuramyl-(pentapeptide) pyrophosphoryl-undecaprenol N-acetylglucosamine transferase
MPIVAVLLEVRLTSPDAEIQVWSDAKFFDRTRESVSSVNPDIIVKQIVSGKLRRYYDVPLWKQLLRFRTIVLPNMLDLFKVAIGILQSIFRLIIWRPDVVFCKGGFVSLPVGIASRVLRIPVVLHDSDAHPGLANKILANWASKIGTGASIEHYPYPKDKTRYVGIPISREYRLYTDNERKEIKVKLGIPTNKPLVVITGGGLGAKPINDASVAIIEDLLKIANVILISGNYQYSELKNKLARYSHTKKIKLYAFLGETMPATLSAADVVVSRAGATTLLELSTLGKPTVLVPNPNLPGGHQTKNAQSFIDSSAVVSIDEYELEEDATLLFEAIQSIITDANLSKSLSKKIQHFAKPDAAKQMASMIMAFSKKGKK